MKRLIYFSILIFSCTTTFGQWTVNGVSTNLITIQDLHFVSGGTGYAVGTNQIPNGNAIISKTTNGGNSWSVVFTMAPQVTPNVFNFNDINFVTSNVAYATGGYANDVKGIICKTTDGGATWDTLPHNIQGTRILHSFFFTPNEGFCTSGELYKTIDGGITWDTVQTPSGIGNLNKIHFISSDTGYVLGTNTSLLIQSIDGGVTWNTVTLPTTEYTREIHFIDNKTGIISCDNGVILKSTDGGNSWTQTTNNDTLLGDVLALDFTDAQTGFAGTLDGIILKTTDGGDVWNFNFDLETSPFLPIASVYCLEFVNSNLGYAGTSFSFIAKTTNGGGSGSGPSSIDEFSSSSAFDFFPNPASNTIVFKSDYIGSNEAVVLLKSMDSKVLKQHVLDNSLNKMEIADIPAGMYLLEFQFEGKRDVKKLIKQ